MRLAGSKRGQRNAKNLRRQMTPPEIALWLALRRNSAGLRFRRQHAAGNYVLDFFCAPAKLAVEVDGEAHNRCDRPKRDQRRDQWLMSQGLHVLRYAANDLMTNLEGVFAQIITSAQQRIAQPEETSPPSPSDALRAPPPPGGGG